MKKNVNWLLLLYAFIEAQLSRSIFSAVSDLEKQLHDNLDFFFSDKNITIEEKENLLSEKLNISFSLKEEFVEEAKNRLINFKYIFFDKEKKTMYESIAQSSGQKGIAIWKPIWDYIISQFDDIYKFDGKYFWVISEKQMYIKTKIPVGQQVCTIAGKPENSFLTSRKKILEKLFPDRELLMANLSGYYYASGKPLILSRVNPFFDEEVGILYHQRLIENKLNPIYLQFGDAIEVYERSLTNDSCKKIIGKSQKTNPLMYFEKGEVVIIPFEEVQDNKIMDYLIKNIDIKTLNSLDIINNYIRKKLQLDIMFS